MSLKKIITLCIVLFSITTTIAQSELNNYQYTVVPFQYEFLKGKDTYRLNTLTKYLFKGQGFTTFFSEQEELPEALNKDRCLGMYVDVVSVKGGFLKTKLQILIKDCKGNVIYTSEVGTSKEKEYKVAYNEALRNAFKSIENLDYKYQPNTSTTPETTKIVPTPKPPTVVDPPKPKPVETPKVTVTKTASTPNIITTSETIKANTTKADLTVLIAKPIANGYQLTDANAALVMTLLSTASDETFIVDGKKAIVFKENGKWLYSENKGYTISREELQIRF